MFIITKDYITKKGEEGYATGKTTFGLIETPTGVSKPSVTAIKKHVPNLLKAQLRDDDGEVYYDALVTEDGEEELFDWGAYWAGTAQLFIWNEKITYQQIMYELAPKNAKLGDSGWVYTI